MSASDAAPLPRLGEVFFDVRGDSRSMRLSWYADTGIAVFSIWQGGMCTGTFRLPMDDLSRMIEILQRGPDRGPGRRRRQPEAADYRAGNYGVNDYPGDDHAATEYGAVDYGAADYEADYEDSGYQRRDYGAAGDHPESRRPPSGSDYLPGNYPDREYPTGTYWRDESGYQPDVAGQERFGETHEAGYGQDRFVPPYVNAQDMAYPNDNPAGGTGPRRGFDQPAYPIDRSPGSSQQEPYPEQPRSRPGYFDRSDYRLAADPDRESRHSAGKLRRT